MSCNKVRLYLLCVSLLPGVVRASVQSCHVCATQSTACVEGKTEVLHRMDCQNFSIPNLNDTNLLDIVQNPSIYNFLQKLDSQLNVKSQELTCLTYEFETDLTTVLRTCIPAEFLGNPICNYVRAVGKEFGFKHGFCHTCGEDDCNWAYRSSNGDIVTPAEGNAGGSANMNNKINFFICFIIFLTGFLF